MIDGVKIIEKKVITDYRGKILHMMRVDDNNFDKFGLSNFKAFKELQSIDIAPITLIY